MKVPTLKSGQMLTLAYFIGILVVLFVVYKILGAVGIIQTRKKKLRLASEEKAETALRATEYFDPNFLVGRMEGYAALNSVAAQHAQTLRNAIAGFGTNEEAIFAVFNRLKSKYNIAEVAYRYKYHFNRDLLTDLLDDLNDAEQVTLFNIINKLPVK